MLDTTQKGIICLLKSAVTGAPFPLPDGFDMEAVYPVVIRHCVCSMAFVGAAQCGISRQHPVMQKLFAAYCKELIWSTRQMEQVNRICALFDRNQIDYMPLKGCLMKDLYPNPELRYMGDADILIRTEQYDRIRPLMQELGFEEQQESDHELVWNSDALHLELHKRLIPSYNKDYYRYYGDGWKMAKVQSGTRYAMTDEDQFVFLFTHFSKHYRDGGIGLRHLTDLWVFRRQHPELNQTYISAELEKLGLNTFFQHVSRVLDACFCGGSFDERSEFILSFIFSSGVWGKMKNHILSAGVKEISQTKKRKYLHRKYILHRIFPSAATLECRYQYLKKAPFLLPVAWICRGCNILFTEPRKIKSFQNAVNTMTSEQIIDYQSSLAYVGLKFQFDEPKENESE